MLDRGSRSLLVGRFRLTSALFLDKSEIAMSYKSCEVLWVDTRQLSFPILYSEIAQHTSSECDPL